MEKRSVDKVDVDLFLGDQRYVFDSVLEFLDRKDSNIALIKAPAGFGKTWVVGSIIEHLLHTKHGKIGVLAPTGQAVKVCRDNASYTHSQVQYGTIHSAFAMRPKKDSDKMVFVQDKTKKAWANDCTVLFIDEVSQLEDQLFHLINEYTRRSKCKVVFSGDEFQIPPIGEKFSIPFDPKESVYHRIETFELTIPIRQKYGNPILDNADIIRTNIKRPFIYEDRIDTENSVSEKVRHIENKDLDATKLVSEYFLSLEYTENPHFVKVLAWRNSTVDTWNTQIRKLIYGGNPNNLEHGKVKQMMKGELLIASKPFVEKDEFTSEDTVIFSNNTELIVESFVLDKYDVDNTGTYIINYYDTVVSFLNNNGMYTSHSIRVVDNNSKTVFEKVSKILLDIAFKAPKGSMEAAMCWKDYWGFAEMFAEVNYAYAITAHKSQGSTYENAIVVEHDIMANPNVFERNRILYVAATRSKKHLIQIYK